MFTKAQKTVLIVLLSLLLVFAILITAAFITGSNKKEEVVEVPVEIVEVKYELNAYILPNTITDYQIQLWDELVVASATPSSDLFAQSVGANFVADYFSMADKGPQLYRIGGQTFVYPTMQKTFQEEMGVANIYLSVKNEFVKDAPILPEVTNVTVVSSIPTVVVAEGLERNAFTITYTFESLNPFEGYPTQVEVTLVDIDGFFYVVELK